MIIAALKLTNRFLKSQQRHAGEDVENLSDKCLQDIGFKLDRSRLGSVKPFWMA